MSVREEKASTFQPCLQRLTDEVTHLQRPYTDDPVKVVCCAANVSHIAMTQPMGDEVPVSELTRHTFSMEDEKVVFGQIINNHLPCHTRLDVPFPEEKTTKKKKSEDVDQWRRELLQMCYGDQWEELLKELLSLLKLGFMKRSEFVPQMAMMCSINVLWVYCLVERRWLLTDPYKIKCRNLVEEHEYPHQQWPRFLVAMRQYGDCTPSHQSCLGMFKGVSAETAMKMHSNRFFDNFPVPQDLFHKNDLHTSLYVVLCAVGLHLLQEGVVKAFSWENAAFKTSNYHMGKCLMSTLVTRNFCRLNPDRGIFTSSYQMVREQIRGEARSKKRLDSGKGAKGHKGFMRVKQKSVFKGPVIVPVVKEGIQSNGPVIVPAVKQESQSTVRNQGERVVYPKRRGKKVSGPVVSGTPLKPKTRARSFNSLSWEQQQYGPSAGVVHSLIPRMHGKRGFIPAFFGAFRFTPFVRPLVYPSSTHPAMVDAENDSPFPKADDRARDAVLWQMQWFMPRPQNTILLKQYAKSLSSSFARKVISSGGGLHLVAAFADEGVTPLHSGLFIQPGGMIWRSKFLSDEMRARAAAFDYSPPNLTEERVDWIDPVLFMWLVTGECGTLVKWMIDHHCLTWSTFLSHVESTLKRVAGDISSDVLWKECTRAYGPRVVNTWRKHQAEPFFRRIHLTVKEMSQSMLFGKQAHVPTAMGVCFVIIREYERGGSNRYRNIIKCMSDNTAFFRKVLNIIWTDARPQSRLSHQAELVNPFHSRENGNAQKIQDVFLKLSMKVDSQDQFWRHSCPFINVADGSRLTTQKVEAEESIHSPQVYWTCSGEPREMENMGSCTEWYVLNMKASAAALVYAERVARQSNLVLVKSDISSGTSEESQMVNETMNFVVNQLMFGMERLLSTDDMKQALAVCRDLSQGMDSRELDKNLLERVRGLAVASYLPQGYNVCERKKRSGGKKRNRTPGSIEVTEDGASHDDEELGAGIEIWQDMVQNLCNDGDSEDEFFEE